MIARRKQQPQPQDSPAAAMEADAAAGVTIIDLALPVGDLIPYERNARKHPQSQIEELAARYKTFGFTAPIIVDETNMILSGHGRAEAAKLAGLSVVPCRQVIGLSDDLKRAYVLWDNKSALDAVWDDAMLFSELEELATAGHIEFTGFTAADIDSVLHSAERRADGAEMKLRPGTLSIIIDNLPSEQAQRDLLSELEARGIACRALML